MVGRKKRIIKPNLKQKSKEDIGRGDIGWLYSIILGWNPNDDSYPHTQGKLTSAKTKLFDDIVDELEKRYYDI